jgi:hypothetical protein
MEHPINIYHVITRMVKDWPKKLELISAAEDKLVRSK